MLQSVKTILKKNRKKSFLIAGTVVFLLTLSSYWFLKSRHDSNRQEAATVAPNTVQVERGEVLQSVSAPGQVIDSGGVFLQAGVGAVVEEIFVQPGEKVIQGQLLIRLGEEEQFERLVSEANIEMLEAQKELDELDPETLLSSALLEVVEAEQEYEEAVDARKLLDCRRATEETLELARSDVAIAKSALRQAEEQFDAVADCTEDDLNRREALERLQEANQELARANANLTWYLGSPGGEEIDEMDARVEVAASKLQQARNRYEQAQQNRHPDMLLAQARIENTRVTLEAARADLNNLEIFAPFDGIVSELSVQNGQAVVRNDQLLQIVNPASLQIETTVTEEDIPYISEGQAADIFLDAMPEMELGGKILHILPKRASSERPLFIVIIQPDQIPDRLFPGMTADASLIIDSRQDVLRLPRAVVRARSDGSAEVEVWQKGSRVSRSITTGLRGDSYIEILSGLQEGDQVVAE